MRKFTSTFHDALLVNRLISTFSRILAVSGSQDDAPFTLDFPFSLLYKVKISLRIVFGLTCLVSCSLLSVTNITNEPYRFVSNTRYPWLQGSGLCVFPLGHAVPVFSRIYRVGLT